MENKVVAIIPAAGSAKRMGAKKNKTLLEVAGKPVLVWTLEAFEKCASIDRVVLVANSEDVQAYRDLLKKWKIKKVSAIVNGGVTRAQSVKNGLDYVSDADYVLIHDAARALITPEVLEHAIREAYLKQAVIAAVPVTDTIKQVSSSQILKTVDRNMLWSAQTPQVFKKTVLQNALIHASVDITDEAAALEQSGVAVHITKGSYDNIKITSPFDLLLADTILKKRLGDK